MDKTSNGETKQVGTNNRKESKNVTPKAKKKETKSELWERAKRKRPKEFPRG